MKLVIVINNELKMDKGKIARVCMQLGFKARDIKRSLKDDIFWKLLMSKGIVLKSDNNYEDVLNYLKRFNIEHICFIDGGKTSVKALSNCGVIFFIKDGEYEFIESLKLL